MAAQEDLEVHQMDVKTAYLNGDLDEEMYMAQPEGFVQAGQENKVCKLRRAIYGLKQAGRAWYQKIDSCFGSLGRKRTHSDSCVYQQRKDGIVVIVAIYVDDLLILLNNKAATQRPQGGTSKRFEMTG